MAAWASAVIRARGRSLAPLRDPRWVRRAALGATVGIAVASGLLIANGAPEVAIVIVLALPVVALVLRYPFAGVILWLLAMPFGALFQAVDQASPVHWAAHRLGIPGLVVVAITYHLLGLKRTAFRVGVADAALAGFIGLGLINILILSQEPARTFVQFYDELVVPIMFFWLIRLLAPGARELRYLIPVAVWTIVVQSSIGVLSWVAPSILPAEWLVRAGERTAGTFSGPAPYTVTIVFFSLLLVYWATTAKGSRILLAVVCMGLLAVFLSLSRGSWLGAAVAFSGLALIRPRFVARVGAVLVVLVALIALGPLGAPIGRVSERFNNEETVEIRLLVNDASFQMIAERPALGFGYGNFELFDEQYKRSLDDVPLRLGGSAHNTYLNLAAELGLPATVAYYLPPLLLLLLTFRARKRLRLTADWLLLAVLWLALVDQAVVNNFLEMIHTSEWATSLWWMALGWIAVVLERHRTAP